MIRNHGIFGSAGQDGFSSPGGTACNNTFVLVNMSFPFPRNCDLTSSASANTAS